MWGKQKRGRRAGGVLYIGAAIATIIVIVLIAGVTAGGFATADTGADREMTTTQLDDDDELEVLSRPEGADVYVDDEHVGETPWSTDELDDAVEVRVEHEDDEEVFEDVTAPDTLRVDFDGGDDDDEPETDILTIESDPAGATVVAEDRELGETPLEEPVPVDEPVTITIEKPGYETVRETDVTGGDTLEIDLEDEHAEKPLEIESVEATESVSEGNASDVHVAVSLENPGDEAVSETVTLSLEGQDDVTTTAEVDGDERETVTLEPDLQATTLEDGSTYTYTLETDANDVEGAFEVVPEDDDGAEDGDSTENESEGEDTDTPLDLEAPTEYQTTAGETVSLEATATDDATLEWDQADGPSVDLEIEDDGESTTFEAPRVDEPTNVILEVEAAASDQSVKETVVVLVEPSESGDGPDEESESGEETDGEERDETDEDDSDDGSTGADRDDEETGAGENESHEDQDTENTSESTVRSDARIAPDEQSPVTLRLVFMLGLVGAVGAYRWREEGDE